MFQWKEKAINEIKLTDDAGGKGKHFETRFLQAGLVKYTFGVCLLDKQTIDGFIQGFVGCPVIINHKDVTDESAKDDRVGVISRVWYNEFDGWYWGEGVIFEQKAIDLIEKGYNVSCQYEITEYSENKQGKLHNGNPYDKTILNGKPEHLAIVENPRYENAMIAVNALEIDMDMEAQNGWITKKTGEYTVDENGEEHAEVKHIWIEERIQPTEWRKWNTKTFYEFKKGDETKFEFNRTRSKISEENISMIKNTLKDMTNTYKFNTIASVNVMGLGEGTLGLCASRTDTSTVTLNPQLFSGKYSQKDYDNSVKAGFHPKGTGDMVKSVLVHEIGHSITVHNSNASKFWDEIHGIRNDYMKNIKPKDIDNPDFISNYARVNEKEFVAEGFCQGVLSKKYGKYTKKIMETIEKYYGKQTQLKLAINEQEENEKNENIWIEEFGGGYPINEEAYKKMKKQQEPPKSKAKNNIIEAINEIKETDMFKNLFGKKEKKMEKEEMKALFMECLTEALQAKNEAEAPAEDEKEPEKKADEQAENECDKKAKDEEEKEQEKKAENEEEEKKEDEEKEKAKNAMDEQKTIINSGENKTSSCTYLSKAKAIELGNQLF